LDVQLTYRGAAVVSPRGEAVAAGRPYTFGYARYFVPVDWTVRYFAFTEQSQPDTHPETFARVLESAPLRTDHRDRLDFMSGRAIAEGVPADRVAVIAEGEVTLQGPHEIRTISDDGVRVSVDGVRVIDHWAPHESAIDRAIVPAGRHRLEVEYYELTGFAELRLELLRR
jgi:PA14 domain-containing protein